MSAATLPSPDGAFDYIVDQLAAGLSLSRAASGQLRRSHSETLAVVPTNAERGSLSSFGTALGVSGDGTTVADLADELASRFAASRMIVSLPLAQPGDASLASIAGSLTACDDEVYVAIDLAADRPTVEHCLRAHDPSFGYALVVVDPVGAGRNVCPTEALESGDYRLRAAVVGAYDGEGFLVAVA
jgi:hypothetical protein